MNREDRFEAAAKRRSLANQLVKSLGDGKCLATPSVEDYAQLNGFEVHIHYRLRGPHNDCREYCAVVKAALNGPSRRDLDRGWVSFPAFAADLALLDHRHVFDEKAMFVSYVGIVKEAEGTIAVPARMVRLHILQDCGCRITDKLIDLLLSESDSVPADRESGVKHPWRFNSTVMLDHKRPEEMIDRASGVVDTVSDDQRPIDHGRLTAQLQSKDVNAMLFGVHFFRDAVSLRIVNEGAQGVLERVTVISCPRELGAIGP